MSLFKNLFRRHSGEQQPQQQQQQQQHEKEKAPKRAPELQQRHPNLDKLPKYTFFNIINDEKRTSKTVHNAIDPRTEEALWDSPVASAQDLEDAIAAANTAFKTWSQVPLPERQEKLVKMGEIITQHADELKDMLMRETGKSVCPS